MQSVNSPARRTINPAYFLILAMPVLIYLSLEFVLKTFGTVKLNVMNVVELAEHSTLIELVARYKFLASFVFFSMSSIAVLVIFALDLWHNYTRRCSIHAILALAGSAAFALFLTVMQPDAFGNFRAYYLLGEGLFSELLGTGAVGYCDGFVPGCNGLTSFDIFQSLGDFVNRLTPFSAAAALTGIVLALGHPVAPEQDETKRQLEATRIVQRYIYCAGLLLTSGMTFFMAWAYWPSGMIGDDTARTAYKSLVGSITLYVGVGYSILILSCYLPVMMILAQRAREIRIALETKGQSVPAGIATMDYVSSLKTAAAILSPIFAGAIGTFGDSFLSL